MKRLASVEDFRRAARRRLPGMLFHFIDGGSYAEQTLARNVADLEELALRQRVMRDTSIIDMSTELLGRRYGMPVGLCPIGMLGMLARRGEVQAGRAATAMKAPYLLSTMSVCSVEEVAKAADPPWFQLYMMKDRGYIRELLARAAAAGCSVLVLTADLSVTGARYRDVRTGFTGERGFGGSLTQVSSAALSPRWAWDVILRGGPHDLGNINDALPVGEKRTLGSLATYVAKSLDRSVTWKDLDWLREQWSGPIAVKGILDKEDARAAHAAGAQAVIVSNHGGRQLDGVSSAIRALPRIAEAIGDEVEVYMDGGVRSGLDVLKAMALGAKACFIGRPYAYALAAGGQGGVTRLLKTFRAELTIAMVLTGCCSLDQAGPGLLDS